MANLIETLDMNPSEQSEVFLSIGYVLPLVVADINLNRFLRSVICETLGVPEDTPDDQLNSNVADILPVLIERVRSDYPQQIDIDAFVTFIVTEMRAGRLSTALITAYLAKCAR